MQGQINHTTTIKPAQPSRRGRIGTAVVLTLVILGVGFVLMGRSSATQFDSTTAVAHSPSASVAPVDSAQIAALARQHTALRERLSTQVAPVDANQIMRLTSKHGALRQRLGTTVAPVDSTQIAALVRQQASLRARLGITVAPAAPEQITALVRQ